MDVEAAGKFLSALGILGCFCYLVWMYVPDDFMMPRDKEDKDE